MAYGANAWAEELSQFAVEADSSLDSSAVTAVELFSFLYPPGSPILSPSK
jgi:hypothetical protein